MTLLVAKTINSRKKKKQEEKLVHVHGAWNSLNHLWLSGIP